MRVHLAYSASALLTSSSLSEQGVELLVGDGERRVAADQQARGGAGRKAIEIGIGQDRDPVIGDLEQACLDRSKGAGLDQPAAKNPAARIAVSDPLDVLLDGEPAVRDPAQPGLDRIVEPRADAIEFGIAAEQLLRRVPDLGAAVLGKQWQRFGDRRRTAGGGVRPGLRASRMHPAKLECSDCQQDGPH
jgi:hypothetical protein